MIALKHARRDDLIRFILARHETIPQQARVIAAQQARIAALDERVTRLTGRVGTLIAAREAAAGKDAGGGSLKRTRAVIAGPVVPAMVREQVSLERCCPPCQTRHTPAVAPVGEIIGTQRFGVGLVSLIATLRAEARLPVRMIHRYLATVHRLSVRVGAINGASQPVARGATGTVRAMGAAIAAGPVAHPDERGWREKGVNGYTWVCATPDGVHLAWGSRAAAMVERLVGAEYAGVLVSDFDAGYAPDGGGSRNAGHTCRAKAMTRAWHIPTIAVCKQGRRGA